MLSQVPWDPHSKLHRAARDKYHGDDQVDHDDHDHEDDDGDVNSLILQKSPVQWLWQLQVPEEKSKLP